jgi:hypothetical protein
LFKLVVSLGKGDALKSKINAELTKRGLNEAIGVTDPVVSAALEGPPDPYYRRCTCEASDMDAVNGISYCKYDFSKCDFKWWMWVIMAVICLCCCCGIGSKIKEDWKYRS